MLKIKEIRVENLFDVFYHQIVLNDSGLTLILGENGFGKTVLLKMVKAVFQKEFEFLESVLFHQLIIIFSDESKWAIKKLQDENKKFTICKFYNATKYESEFTLIRKDIDYSDGLPVGESFKILTLNNEGKIIKQEPQWFTDTLEKINISLIETQRLLIKKNVQTPFHGIETEYNETIVELSNDLKFQIKSVLAK